MDSALLTIELRQLGAIPGVEGPDEFETAWDLELWGGLARDKRAYA